MTLARCAPVVLVFVLGAAGPACTCTPTVDDGPPAVAPRELARWDFRAANPSAASTFDVDAGGAVTSLWPRAPGAPERRRHAVELKGDAATLDIEPTAADPQLRWQFARGAPVWIARADVEMAAPANLQLFWTSAACPTFTEACSTTARVGSGRSVVDMILPPTRGNTHTIRALRFDTPEGQRVTVHSFVVRSDAKMSAPWRPREGTQLEVGTEGLTLSSQVPDPGMVIDVAGVDAEAVSGFEVGMTGPPTAKPQIFWRGAECPAFTEECSVFLVPDGAEASAWRASPASTGHWKGRIDELRFDPSDVPAKYVVERLVLVRAGR